MNYRRRSISGSISGGIVLLGLALAFAFGGFNLPIFFVALAFAALVGSLSNGSAKSAYGGIQGFIWLLGLAFCFAVGWWPWILVVAGVSIILGALLQPIVAGLIGLGIVSSQPVFNQPPQYYQPPQQSQTPQPPYQAYQQGYQPPPQSTEVYQEGGRQHQYPPQAQQPSQQYEQPQAQYPQQMPPQQ
ncbi:MAG TPA: hypothetical protein VFB12_23940 [Ktedonobacteraceae bacterium]|nr:hypothetical protein [Ktedonobacteraceae bacterium]